VDAEVRPKVWIVDIDGTLALKGDRKPFDWGRVGEDEPNDPVIAVVRALRATGCGIVYVTGRMECCRAATAAWLDANVLPSLGMLLMMRPDGDFRPDEALKREIYETRLRSLFDVAGVIDDRAKVVRMWRHDLGLTCLQVADGDF
jgi:hypothetical protein